MATLVSPGASVTVQNDSFYAASGSGSVPLVIFATAQDKLVPGSTSVVAEGTKKANAGKLYLMTSQRDALQTFGMPIFQEKTGTVVQGDELNEYGLHGLFSALGITNRAYAMRSDIDLNSLSPTQVEPRGAPLNQTLWFDVANTDFGMFEHQGTTYANEILNWKKITTLIPEVSQVEVSTGAPIGSFGMIGDYAVVPYLVQGNVISAEIDVGTIPVINRLFYKDASAAWVLRTPVAQEMTPPSNLSKGSVWMKLDSAASGFNPKLKRFAAGYWSLVQVTAANTIMEIEAKLQTSLRAGNDAFVGSTTRYFAHRMNDRETMYTLADSSQVVGKTVTLTYTSGSVFGQQQLIHKFTTPEAFVAAINNSTPLVAIVNSGTIVIKSLDGRQFKLQIQLTPETVKEAFSSHNWVPTRYFAQLAEPTVTAAEGTLWYDNSLYADIMVNNGGKWCGLRSADGIKMFNNNTSTDIQIRQSEPLEKSEGGDLTFGDMWIDPQDGTNFEFYQYSGSSWLKLDQTDQSTTMGMLFADARSSNENGIGYFTSDAASAKTALLMSDYVDPTCPDPRLYPRGMLMVNLAQTGGVVRRYDADAFETIAFIDYNNDTVKEEYMVGDPMSYPLDANGKRIPLTLAAVAGSKRGRWVTASGVADDGAGVFGRAAQRKLIVESMAAVIIGNDDLRAETIEFNIIVAPGYAELLDETITLNVDRKETAYIITDVPARLNPTATSINEWAKNMNNAPSNGDRGRTSRYDYAAQYMGWCLGTNVDGKEVCIPGSTVALRTYLFNDQVSYVWFPPAGTERGVVTNAASVGYITSEGEYAPVIYNQGQRDVMYLNNINPIALRPNRGLLVFGDKSLAPTETALDRVNVGRLVVYIRTQIAKISERFLFKLNTPRVREEFAGALTSFLANIMLLEGLEDFAVVCDGSNNTAERRQRNELWADVAIVPTKSINFIYVPIRIQNASN